MSSIVIRLCLILTLALTVGSCRTISTKQALQDFAMVSASFLPAQVDAPKGKMTVITFHQETRVEAPSEAQVGIVDIWRNMGEGTWHFLGPGFASIGGVQLLPRLGRVAKKFGPCTNIFLFIAHQITFCVAPDPQNPPNAELIAFCTFDSEDYGRYRGHRVFPESWEYRPGWQRPELHKGLPAKLQMPSRSELEALLAQPPKLELLGVSPSGMGITMNELEESIARESKFFPPNIKWLRTLPQVIEIPEVVEASGSFTLEADSCGYLFKGEDANPDNNCATTAKVTITIQP